MRASTNVHCEFKIKNDPIITQFTDAYILYTNADVFIDQYKSTGLKGSGKIYDEGSENESSQIFRIGCDAPKIFVMQNSDTDNRFCVVLCIRIVRER